VPPYVIFSDKSLHDMCRLLPTTTETMLAVNGVGRAKLERYGNKFLSVIDAWLTDNPDVKQPGPLPGMIRKPAAAARDSSTIKESAELAGKGLSLEEIAVQRGLKPTTIAVHLATWIEEGNQLDIDHLVDEKKRNLLQEQFTLHGTDFLKPAVEALEGRVNYEEARIVRACLCRRK